MVVQDNGPGIVKAQVPKIFGKLLYGSKFHRLKQARGQQGIGISAAAMYGQLTTGKPIRVTSRVGKGKAAHVFDIQLDTRKNEPVVTHDDDARRSGTRSTARASSSRSWPTGSRASASSTATSSTPRSPTRTRPSTTRGRWARRQRASADRPGNETLSFPRATTELPKEAVEIKPHPHGVELGALMLMARESKSHDVRGFLQTTFSRVSVPGRRARSWPRCPGARRRCGRASLGENRAMAEELHKAIAATKLMSPPTNCLSPIGDELMRKGLVSFLNVIESEGESGDENAQLDLDSAGMKPAKKGAQGRRSRRPRPQPRRRGAGPRRAAARRASRRSRATTTSSPR